MNRAELEDAVAVKLRDDNIRKPVSIKNDSFFIRMGSGNEVKFDVAPIQKNVIYTRKDVSNIITAFIETVLSAIARGEKVSIRGFGTFDIHKRKSARVVRFGSDIWDEIPEQWVPKFISGEPFRLAARLYGLSQKDTDDAASAKSVYIGGS